LRLLVATAAIALPHHGKSEPSKRSRRDPVPVVTTRVERAIALPPRHAYETLIREAADRYGVEAALITSIMQVESAFDALAVSRAGARGLMQLMPALAQELGVEDSFDARQNVMAGARYLRRLLDLYDNNLRLVLAGYNAGVTNVRRYGGVPPFRETQNYVERVMALLERERREDNGRSRTRSASEAS
jgi:soluble lytic murein transglycosylase-like protein